MKHGVASKNAVVIDSLQASCQLSCTFYKNFYIWSVKPICFATPKLHFATQMWSRPMVWEALT